MAYRNCGCRTRRGGCDKDICNSPICGRPSLLSIYAPVIYDEIGINICRPLTIPAAILAENPTVDCVQLEVINITFTEAGDGIPATTITNTARANCSTVVLTNILVTYRAKLFDSNNNFLTSTIITANYLPGSATSPDYAFFDSETNPESVTIELYTPYGVGYLDAGDTEFINVVGLVTGFNTVVNGINASAVAKAMNFDPTTGIMSAGISVILRTVYFEAYKFEHQGKPVPPKASLSGDQSDACLAFVESGLLSREIKPLELEPPNCEGELKDTEAPCERDDCTIKVLNSCQCAEKEDNCNEQNTANILADDNES